MTLKKLLLLTFLQLAILTLLKIYFFNGGLFSNPWLLLLFWVLVLVVVSACVRRFGVLNFFEVIFIFFIWLVLDGFVDLVFTSAICGLDIFKTLALWVGYAMLALAIAFAHKKRHLHIRHKLSQKHH